MIQIKITSMSKFLLLLLFGCSVLFGCTDTTTEKAKSEDSPSFLTISEVEVPVFQSAEEQINYTRSWFVRVHEKKAALDAFIKLYPQNKKYCALAALDLAYLQLGIDYRLAQKHERFAAIGAYKDILKEYHEFPNIMAKAHWYIGWIYLELLKDREKGIEEFNKVIMNYPRQGVSLMPPTPWISLIYQEDDGMTFGLSSRLKNHWAAMALVEIIRYAKNEEEGWNAFTKLRKNYSDNVAYGFGLRLMLQRRFHTLETVQIAQGYSEIEFSNVYLLGDIQKEINEITATKGGIVR